MSEYDEVYETVRMGAVGAGGIFGTANYGLGGGAVGGIAGGAITDTVFSVVTTRPHGYIKDMTDTMMDGAKGRVPIVSATRAGRRLVTDGVSGMVAGKLFCPGNATFVLS